MTKFPDQVLCRGSSEIPPQSLRDQKVVPYIDSSFLNAKKLWSPYFIYLIDIASTRQLNQLYWDTWPLKLEEYLFDAHWTLPVSYDPFINLPRIQT